MLLLDTNALLWLSAGDQKLGSRALGEIERAVRINEAAFSAISVWEVAMLVDRNRYTLGQGVEDWRLDLIEAGLLEAPVDGRIAALSVTMRGLPADPADRLIAATSARLDARLVTADQRLLAWSKEVAGRRAIDARK
jgi:PIN domain nuclease of toxin-antitoxin system